MITVTIKDKRKGYSVKDGEDVVNTGQQLHKEYRLFGVLLFKKVIDFDYENLSDTEKKKVGFKTKG